MKILNYGNQNEKYNSALFCPYLLIFSYNKLKTAGEMPPITRKDNTDANLVVMKFYTFIPNGFNNLRNNKREFLVLLWFCTHPTVLTHYCVLLRKH